MCKTTVVAVALLALMASLPATAAPGCAAQRSRFSVHLADATSRAEVMMPPRGRKAVALVELFPGSDVADLDGAVTDRDGRILSRPLLQVAERLACAGYISLRYDKRYVTGPTHVDRPKFDKLNGSDLVDDGVAALTEAKAAFPVLRRMPLAVFGWSEGTTVAMAVATRLPDVRAIVLMAPVVEGAAVTAQRQWPRIGRPYLAQYASNGGLDAAAVARAGQGGGGVSAQIFVGMFRGFRPGETLNPLLDTNGDGRIELTEADAVIAGWYADNPESGLGMSTTARALPGVKQALPALKCPVLIVQGLNDSMIDAAPAQALTGDNRVTVRVFPGLGHSLGPATSVFADNLAPIAAAPLDAITGFLDAQFR